MVKMVHLYVLHHNKSVYSAHYTPFTEHVLFIACSCSSQALIDTHARVPTTIRDAEKSDTRGVPTAAWRQVR